MFFSSLSEDMVGRTSVSSGKVYDARGCELAPAALPSCSPDAGAPSAEPSLRQAALAAAAAHLGLTELPEPLLSFTPMSAEEDEINVRLEREFETRLLQMRREDEERMNLKIYNKTTKAQVCRVRDTHKPPPLQTVAPIPSKKSKDPTSTSAFLRKSAAGPKGKAPGIQKQFKDNWDSIS
mmetsp:Transcript_38929/g.54068  ORF Transcript_38929/g.54068 Transcript_38929/m.54068 type:complete len:180 (-) Transcript_38929:112-651(-)